MQPGGTRGQPGGTRGQPKKEKKCSLSDTDQKRPKIRKEAFLGLLLHCILFPPPFSFPFKNLGTLLVRGRRHLYYF